MEQEIIEINQRRSVKFKNKRGENNPGSRSNVPLNKGKNTQVPKADSIRNPKGKVDRATYYDRLILDTREKVKQWLDSTFDSSDSGSQSGVQVLEPGVSDYRKEVNRGAQKGNRELNTRQRLDPITNECNLNCFSRRAMRTQRRDQEAAGSEARRREQSTDKKRTNQGPLLEGPVDRRLVKTQTQKYKGVGDRDSDGESVFSVQSRASTATIRTNMSVGRYKNQVKSGFLDKPRSSVLVKHRWPHMNQDPRYVTKSLSFNQLNFAQFVGGECRTISRTSEPKEHFGRLKILAKVAYLYDVCKNWEKARSVYFAIVSNIEEGETTWSSALGHYDVMCPASSRDTKVEKSGPPQGGFRPRNPGKRVLL